MRLKERKIQLNGDGQGIQKLINLGEEVKGRN